MILLFLILLFCIDDITSSITSNPFNNTNNELRPINSTEDLVPIAVQPPKNGAHHTKKQRKKPKKGQMPPPIEIHHVNKIGISPESQTPSSLYSASDRIASSNISISPNPHSYFHTNSLTHPYHSTNELEKQSISPGGFTGFGEDSKLSNEKSSFDKPRFSFSSLMGKGMFKPRRSFTSDGLSTVKSPTSPVGTDVRFHGAASFPGIGSLSSVQNHGSQSLHSSGSGGSNKEMHNNLEVPARSSLTFLSHQLPHSTKNPNVMASCPNELNILSFPSPSTEIHASKTEFKLKEKRSLSVDLNFHHTDRVGFTGSYFTLSPAAASYSARLKDDLQAAHHRRQTTQYQVIETSSIYAKSESPDVVTTQDGVKETTQGKVNQYDIMKDIGSGAYGRVVLVRNGDNGRYYACKIISKSRIRKKFRWTNAGPARSRTSTSAHAGSGGSGNGSGQDSASPDGDISPNSKDPELGVVEREIAILKKLSKHRHINSLVEVLDDGNEDNLYMSNEKRIFSFSFFFFFFFFWGGGGF